MVRASSDATPPMLPAGAHRLGPAFFRRDPETLARALLGRRLVRMLRGQRLAGVIVETEAYLGVPDRAAHTFAERRTARNRSMYAPGGTAYVYFTYGMHHCFNIVAGRADDPVAVLIRAIQPTEGIDTMRALRDHERRRRAATPDRLIASGPARLCAALAIDRRLDGIDLTVSPDLWVERGGRAPPSPSIRRGPRIGVEYAGSWARRPLRFWLAGSPWVSR